MPHTNQFWDPLCLVSDGFRHNYCKGLNNSQYHSEVYLRYLIQELYSEPEIRVFLEIQLIIIYIHFDYKTYYSLS